MLDGNPAVIGFKGIYGVFGNAHDVSVVDRIKRLKERDLRQVLPVVWLPEHLDEIADFSRFPYTHEQIAALQTNLHALGVILPASDNAPA